ncbi:LOW QUALITY PROTEIN: armadillo-like helical domain containing protein 1 [Ammospiza maritima maritima]
MAASGAEGYGGHEEEIMGSVKEQEAIAIMVFLQERDSAHKVAQTTGASSTASLNKAGPELELEFQRARLFLAHLTVWLRMLHLYLTEFLEIRGVLIPLEILRLNHLKEEDKRGFIKLLLLTGNTGREYEELICESCGTQHVHLCFVLIQTKFLNASSTAEGQKDAQVLLDSLGHSNPKYQSQDSQGLEAVLLCTSPQAQHGAQAG